MTVVGNTATFVQFNVAGCSCSSLNVTSFVRDSSGISMSGTSPTGTFSSAQSGRTRFVVAATVNGVTCTASYNCVAPCTGEFSDLSFANRVTFIPAMALLTVGLTLFF